MSSSSTILELASDARTKLLAIMDDLSVAALHEACKIVVYHPKFITALGSAGEHHAYEGGLALHTHEVVFYAIGIAKLFPQSDMDVVITSAIFHDFMKIEEYAVNSLGTIFKTPYRNLVRHVAGSHAEFMKAIDGKSVAKDKVLGIEHAMLAHHGRKEWGSPIEPQTIEAFILHDADMFSVKFGPTSKVRS